MLTLKYIILGIVQGITEFFPVSSSAHLVILQKVFGITGEELALSIILHLGTVLALVVFFFKDIMEALRNMALLLLIIIATIITGIIGVTGKDFFEHLFTSTKAVAIALIFTGIILILSKKFSSGKRDILDIKDASLLGLAQGVAIIPGISRSGVTICTLLFSGIDREASFKFSFLAAIPAIIGATLLEAKKINFAFQGEPKNFILGFIFSFFSGILALRALKIILRKAKLHYFGYYCILIAIITILFIK
jgi:undecaprenyl-diphosphatase